MRVLYHHRTTASDGSAVHINGLICALRDQGAEVHVVAPKIATTIAGGNGSSGLNRLRRKLPRTIHELAELSYNVPEVRALRKAVVDFRPDVIYQRSNLYLLSGAHVANTENLPLIEEVNAPYYRERSQFGGIAWPAMARWAERRAWRQADAIVAVTRVLADIVAEQGIPADRLYVMPNGIDEGLLDPSAYDPQAKERLQLSPYLVLGFTGFVREWNGLEAVLEQLTRPEGRTWFLMIVGDGPAREALEQRARELGVAERLRFTGLLQRSDISAHVSAFDIALQPAANPYASPLKLFEYLALGRAIVAPDQPNIREVLQHEENAILFAPGDASSLAAAIARLASSGSLRLRIGAAARAAIQHQHFTWRNNARRVLELANTLIAAKRLGNPSPRAGMVLRRK